MHLLQILKKFFRNVFSNFIFTLLAKHAFICTLCFYVTLRWDHYQLSCFYIFIVHFQVERLQALILDPEVHKFNFTDFDELPLPLDPEIKIKGIEADTATLFKVTV